MRTAVLMLVLTASFSFGQSLDYATYKSKVEPIFMKKRPTHARCIVCHQSAGRIFKLEPFAAGATAWTEEQSRKNFEVISKLVKIGDPLHSILLTHPLAEDAGGEDFHSGGHQFKSQTDPDWKAIADWVKAAK